MSIRPDMAVTHRNRPVELTENFLQLNVGHHSQLVMTENGRHRFQFIAHEICSIIRKFNHLSW